MAGKRKKLHEMTIQEDIRYRGFLNYQHFQLFGEAFSDHPFKIASPPRTVTPYSASPLAVSSPDLLHVLLVAV